MAFLSVTDGEIVQSYVIESPSGSEDAKPLRWTVAPSRAVRALPASATGRRLFLTVTTTVSVAVSVPSEIVRVRV